MANDNYVFDSTNGLLNLDGEQIHQGLNYIWKNNVKLDESITMTVHQIQIEYDDWDTTTNQAIINIDTEKLPPQTEEPSIFNISNNEISITKKYKNVNVIVSPAEESRELYNEYVIRCISQNTESGGALTFQCDQIQGKNEIIYINLLILKEMNSIYTLPNIINNNGTEGGN